MLINFSFLYPTIESSVFTALYMNPSGAPPSIINSIGAITPSDVFSATVSTAAFAIELSSSLSVSRPTMYDKYLRASVKFLFLRAP